MCHTPHNRLHPTIRSINRPTARPPANSPLDRTHSPRLFDRKTLLSSTLHLRPDHTETPSLRPQHHISGAPYRLLHSCNAASLPPEAKPQHRTSGAPYRLLRIRSAASLPPEAKPQHRTSGAPYRLLHSRSAASLPPEAKPQHRTSGAPYRLLRIRSAASLPPEAKPQHRTSGAPYRLLHSRSAASLRTPSLDLRNHDSTCRITPLNNRLRLLRLETTFPTTRHSLRRHRSPHNLRRKPIPKVSTRFP